MIDNIIKDYNNKLNQKKGELNILKTQYKKLYENEKIYSKNLENIEKAQFIIKEVGKNLQNKIKVNIEELVTDCIQDVFNENYDFKMNYIFKRNRIEVDMYLEKDGNKFYPVESNGGGIIDIISFALRLSLFLLQKNKENIIILDEPFRFLSIDLQERSGELLQKLSEKLNIQFIIITHSDILSNYGDKIFNVEKINNVSKVMIEIKNKVGIKKHKMNL